MSQDLSEHDNIIRQVDPEDQEKESEGLTREEVVEESDGLEQHKKSLAGFLGHMQELTGAITDEEVIDFFMKSIVPHVMKVQKPILFGRLRVGQSFPPLDGKLQFIERLEDKLEAVLEGSPPVENCHAGTGPINFPYSK